MHQVTDGLMFPEGPVAMADGSVILVEIRRGTLTRVLPNGEHADHRESRWRPERRGDRS